MGRGLPPQPVTLASRGGHRRHGVAPRRFQGVRKPTVYRDTGRGAEFDPARRRFLSHKGCPVTLSRMGPSYGTARMGGSSYGRPMLIGYARVSTSGQDLTAQLDGLSKLGVAEADIYVDHGLTGRNRDRPGLAKALAAVRSGDQLVITKLDRLARSVPDARDIADELLAKGVALNIGGSVHNPLDPIGKLLFNVLAMVAEFEADLIKTRTIEGMAIAKARGRLKGKKPKMSPQQEKVVIDLYANGEHTVAEIAEMFSVARSTVYRAVERASLSD